MKHFGIRQMKKTAVVIPALILVTGGLSGCGGGGTDMAAQGSGGMQNAGTSATVSAPEETAGTENTGGIHHAEIVIKDYGTITAELDGDTAPVTVENFINLANEGFYDGLTFHRIMDGFMIQGGDPAQGGSGRTAGTIVGEFADNGYDNDISHTAGVISMARTPDPDSASSQFFITVADSEFLDGQYAAFGHVTDGLDVAKQIAKDAEPVDENGTITYEAQPVIETIRITD